MHTPSSVLVLCAVVGLSVASVVVYVAPRLVAHRVRQDLSYPPPLILLPLAGAFLTSWRVVRTIGFEVAVALLFMALAVHYGQTTQLTLSIVYSSVLLAIGYIDWDYRLVPNRLSYPGIVLALLAALLWPGAGVGFRSAAIGGAVALVIFVLLQLLGRGALGTGDTKLALLIGLMRGFPGVFDALLLGVLLGGLAAVVALLVFRRGRKEYIAYAPYLALGAIASFFLTGP